MSHAKQAVSSGSHANPDDVTTVIRILKCPSTWLGWRPSLIGWRAIATSSKKQLGWRVLA